MDKLIQIFEAMHIQQTKASIETQSKEWKNFILTEMHNLCPNLTMHQREQLVKDFLKWQFQYLKKNRKCKVHPLSNRPGRNIGIYRSLFKVVRK